jgi:hypothetical protein
MTDINQMNHMEHSEAVEKMLPEKYLLDELTPELRDAFEEHMFDCPECAYDVRAGAAFVDEAKVQLPQMTAAPLPIPRTQSISPEKKRSLFEWLRPMFASPVVAGPVFAALLVVIGYQNLVTYPALRTEATEPRLLPSVALHAGTRSGGHKAIEADPKQGVVLQVDMPGPAAYTAYSIDLYDPQGKLAWTHHFAAPASGAEDGTLSVMIPGQGLQQGSYTLAISGVTAKDSLEQRTEIERQIFDIHFGAKPQ